VSINPFDDGGTSFVWGDEEAQHSLWAAASVSQPASGQGARLDYIEQNWTDIRPESLQQRLAGDRGLIR
jgi:uncharacterized protein YbdZ (MbtH family)